MSSKLLNSKACSPLLNLIRHGHRLRGKPPGVAKTFAQRLAEKNFEDPELVERNDIGFPLLKPSRSAEMRQRMEHLKLQRKDLNLEKLARGRELKIDLKEARQEWMKTGGPFHIRKVADHYGVFEHLFGKYAFFTPRIPMDIKFKIDDETLCPVYHGNRMKPHQAVNPPEVQFDHTFSMTGEPSEGDSLWTLILTNPDGNFTDQNKECVHWMIGNIPNGNVSKGDIIVPYLQPIAPKGTGYHRHVFVLYKQEKKIDLSSFKVDEPTILEKRTFGTYDFYKKFQDDMTPAGLSFFQASWDESLKSFYHNVLNMKEPIYEYDFPKVILKNEKQFPHRESFNKYMDRYSDPQEVNKRLLEEKLAKTHPFNGAEPKLKFPNAMFFENNEPTWLKTEIRKKRLGRGRINEFNRS